MTRRNRVPWSEVEDAAKEAFEVWVDGSELEWAKQAWEYLGKSGLTTYSNEWERSHVIVRLLSLAFLYRTFCDVAYDERWEPDGCEFESCCKALGLDSFRIGGLVGREFFLEEDVDESAEEFELATRGILKLIDQETPSVFSSIKEGFGGEANLYESLCQTNSRLNEDWDGIGTQPRIWNDPPNQEAACAWIMDGCQRYR